MSKTKLHDHGIHGREGVSDEDGRNWWPLDVTSPRLVVVGEPPWRGHIHPCESGPLRGKLPPAPDGDPAEMRAAEILAQYRATRAFDGISTAEVAGWFARVDGDLPTSAEQAAGWLARAATEDEP